MTIQLPKDVESAITAAVDRGLFATADDAVATAWRAFEQSQSTPAGRDPSNSADRPIWEVLDELRSAVPPEEFRRLPTDGAEQLDHYLYGSPKRPTA